MNRIYLSFVCLAILPACVSDPMTSEQWDRCAMSCDAHDGPAKAKTLWDGKECCQCVDGSVFKKSHED